MGKGRAVQRLLHVSWYEQEDTPHSGFMVGRSESAFVHMTKK